MAFGEIFLVGYSGSPERARWLVCSGSQSQRVVWVILPACGASHIRRWLMDLAFDFYSVLQFGYLRGLSII